jgi:8-oxo-dGTP diphosphatase
VKKGTDYIGVGVGIVVFNADGKILITKRGPKANNDRGKWEIPGGGVEFGETFEQAAQREIKEENDIDIEVIDFLQVTDHILPEEKQHWVAATYICRHVSGEAKTLEPDKCDAVGWFTLDEAEKLDLSGITKHDLAAIKKRYPDGYAPAAR